MHYTANAEPQIIDAIERTLPNDVFLTVCYYNDIMWIKYQYHC